MVKIVELKDATDSSKFGGKAANLAKMLQAGLPVPGGFAASLDAFNQDGELHDEIKEQISDLLDNSKLHAVRSSALAEDAEGASWAGQFETFLNTDSRNVVSKIEECHQSAKDRAKAYASDKNIGDNSGIAVIVQEMIKPEYAGVLFTKDPVTGVDHLVTEYVEGLGEELVSGRADPKRIVLSGTGVTAPFDKAELERLANKVEQVFGSPQDIEWAWTNNKIWLLQTRPITATQTSDKGYYIGEPDELFYWGPSRAKPIYMSDFMAAAERFFIELSKDPSMPQPPKTLVLFHDGKMVWLSNAQDFIDFVEGIFEAYEKRNKFEEDLHSWRNSVKSLDETQGDANQLVRAWMYTLFAEFSLYGAESVLAKRLERFNPNIRQDIWGAFTVPDKPTFLARIDEELLASGDPTEISKKYPWVEDGYDGVNDSAGRYFTERLNILRENAKESKSIKKDSLVLASKLGLTANEVNALELSRNIAEMLDDRKEWMMRTRLYIKTSASKILSGWMFENGHATLINEVGTEELWNRYIDFMASSSAVSGRVASNGGKHFITGEIAVISSPSDSVSNDKILVVPSTSPSYVPLMRKAKALITDHGGMMSHAAIVAREFNLPCIVGTKHATKVLKNGDHVVLDLVKGEVSK